MTTDCIHGLGPVSLCSICNGREACEARQATDRLRVFPAKYSGQCIECDLPIHIGESIAWSPDSGEPAVHEGCAS